MTQALKPAPRRRFLKNAAAATDGAGAMAAPMIAAKPMLSSLRNQPPGAPGSQPILRVASVGQSQEGAGRVGDNQTISIRFAMAQ